ncbi:MAG: nuclease-related domain-containing protein [Anaerolineae bacterium]
MIIVPRRATNLRSGYDRICKTDRTLHSEWRPRLREAYLRQTAAYEREQAQHPHRQSRATRIRALGLGLALLLVLLALALWAWAPAPQGNLPRGWMSIAALALAVVVSAAAVGYAWWARRRALPARPDSYDAPELYAPLLPRWRAALDEATPTDEETLGASAENRFIASLRALDDSYFLAYRLRLKPKGEADVLLVGPKGVWLFEVKDWEGTINYHSGMWWRSDRIERDADGREHRLPRPVELEPDRQWKWICADLAGLMRQQFPSLVKRVRGIDWIRGGVVFMNSRATYNIVGSPVQWGTAEEWRKRLDAAPVLAGMDERVCFQVLDAALGRHREVTGQPGTQDMDACAQELVTAAEGRLQARL